MGRGETHQAESPLNRYTTECHEQQRALTVEKENQHAND